MSWLKVKKKKKIIQVLSSLIVRNNSKPFLDQIVMCNEKWILYDSQQWQPTQWFYWEEAPKHFPKPKFHHKEVMVTV